MKLGNSLVSLTTLVVGIAIGFYIGQNTSRKRSASSAPTAIHSLDNAVPSVQTKPPQEHAQVGEVSNSAPSVPEIGTTRQDEKGEEESRLPIQQRPPRAFLAEALQQLVDEETEIQAFLEKARHPNLFDRIRLAKPFNSMDENLSQLNGKFIGEVYFKEDPDKKWEMQLEAALHIENRKLKGQTRILLSRNGKVFSRLNGKGNMEDYKSIEDGLAILVKASPRDYFQLYYISKMDIFVGNYYKEEKVDTVVPKGTVRLERG